MAAGKDARYGFRSAGTGDLGRIAVWFNEPHVRQWLGEPEVAFARARENLDSISTEMLVVEISGKPAGLVHVYDPHMEDSHPYNDFPTGSLGIVCLIGEPDFVGKGHGSGMVRALLALLFEEGTACVFADPAPANETAIRAFAAAGLQVSGERQLTSGPVLLMAVRNPEFHERDIAE